MHSLNSLYYNLYDVNQDFVLYYTIGKLCKLSKQFQLKKQLKMRSATFMHQTSNSWQEFQDDISLSKSAVIALLGENGQSPRLPKNLIQSSIPSKQKTKTHKLSQNFDANDKIRRQNALNKFSLKCCEYKILHSLEQSTLQVKDSITLFYKRIETRIEAQIDDEEQT